MAADNAATAAKATDMIAGKLHLVNGVPFFPLTKQETVDGLRRDLPLRSDDLFIVTYPKSGTTWMQQIVKLIRTNGVEDGQQIDQGMPWIERVEKDKISDWCRKPVVWKLTLCVFCCYRSIYSPPRVMKSHLNYEMMPGGDPAKSPAKYIYVARNSKDVAVSLFYHTRKFIDYEFTGDWDNFFECFINGKVESGSWFDHVLE